MTGEYLRWGESVWGAIWGVPPGRPVVHGGGNQTVSAIKRSSSGQTPVKVSANGTLSVQGVAAEHVRSSVSLSGGGAIGLVASKRATVRCVVAGGGIATVVGSAHEAISASVSISGGGSQATTARKHAYWGLPIDDGTYFRWGASEWGAIWGTPPITDHAVTGGGHATAAASKAVRVEPGPVASGGGEPVVLARQVRAASVVVSGSGDITVHDVAHEFASGSLTVTGGGHITLTPFKTGSGQVPEQSAGGEIAVRGAKGIPSPVSVSGSGTLLLVVRKNGVSWASVSTGGFLSATGRKGTKVSFVVSSGGLETVTAHKAVDVVSSVHGGGYQATTARKDAYWGLPIDDGTYFRWGVSEWGAIWGAPPTTEHTVTGGGHATASASKAVRVEPGPVTSGGGEPVVLASKGRTAAVAVSGNGDITVHGAALELASASLTVTGGGEIATVASKHVWWGIPAEDEGYFRWGVSNWGDIWGAPDSSPHSISGGGSIAVTALKAVAIGRVASTGGGYGVIQSAKGVIAAVSAGGSGGITVEPNSGRIARVGLSGGGDIGLTPVKIGRGQVPGQSAGGEVTVHGVKGTLARVSVSGSGALLSVARKNGFSRASVSAEGFLTATGRKGTKISVDISAGGLATATAHKSVDVIAAVSGGGVVGVSGWRVITIRATVHVTGSGFVLVTCLAGRYAAVSVTGNGRSSITFQGPRWALVPTRRLHGHKMPLKPIGEVLQTRRLPVCNIETKPLKGKIVKPRCTEWEVNKYR